MFIPGKFLFTLVKKVIPTCIVTIFWFWTLKTADYTFKLMLRTKLALAFHY